VADHLQQLLDLFEETRMIDRLCQLDMTEMTRALGHILVASGAFELSVDGSETRVVQSLIARLCSSLVHGLGVQNVTDTHVLDLLRR